MLHDMSHMYALKSVIEDLLGSRAWYDLKETTSVATWRKYVFKLFDAIELSVKTTILIRDDDWMQEVQENIKHGRELGKIAKNTDDLIAALTATLLRQVFLQLGSCPSRKTVQSAPLKAQHWDFSGFRSVQIVQTPQQREMLLLSKQRRKIGAERQRDLEAEFRKSETTISYAEWCEEHEPSHVGRVSKA